MEKKEKIDKLPRPVYAKNGNFAGMMVGNIFRKRVEGSKHMFHSIGKGAWGIDYDIIHEQIPENGVVEVVDRETKTLYQVPVSQYKEFGTVLHFKEKTADHYTQVFLPLEAFTQVKMGG